MKKLTVILTTLALIGLTGVVMAQTDGTHNVQVTVSAINRIVVDDADVAFTIDDPGLGADYSLPSNQTSTLSYSHNNNSNRKITATAVADGGNGTNNISITANLATGDGAKTIVSSGTGQAVDVKTAIGRGYASDLVLTYAVTQATIAGTPTGTYTWTVTYTLTN